MTPQHFGQLAATLVAVLTPLLVVAIVRLVAVRHGRLVQTTLVLRIKSMRMLAWATLGIGTVALLLVSRFAPLSLWPAVIDLAAFALLAVPAMQAIGEIDAASRPSRMVGSTSREASLAPRRLTDYISLPVRLIPFVITTAGIATFVIRAAIPAGPRQLFVPVTFTAAAVIFLWLYETWMHDLVAGPVVAASTLDDEARRRSIRRVLGMESILTLTCLSVANLLLNLDWKTAETAGTAATFIGAVIAIIGCAFALASGLGRRVYADAGRT